MTMFRWPTRLAAASLAVSAALASGAAASVTFPSGDFTISYGSDGLWGPVGSKTGPEAINTTGTPNVYAGGFNMEVLDANGSIASFIAFCLDVTGRLADDTLYTVTEDPFDERDVSGRKGLIENLFDSSYDAAADWTKQQWAGFQLAAWEIVEEMQPSADTPTLNVDKNNSTDRGDFYLTSYDPGVLTAAQDFLSAAQDYDGPRRYNVTYLQSLDGDGDGTRDSQSLITVSPVPLPAAGLLMLGALGGGAVVYRRRKTV